MKLYTCEYCYKEFEPTRRRVQKYCSNSCRSKAYHYRQVVPNTLTTSQLKSKNISTTSTPQQTKNESISAIGIGNAAAGNILADGLKALLTSSENKPATKKDILDLKSLITQRYLPINNLEKNQHGQSPFYDIETKSLVYLNTF
ncbi:hypothetical protein JAO71_08590 [Olleya sp. YSTF-M6]|uniref:Uncharacterized protein n=1 Tax=Olleya sediminilitoris TaxID=2795739 RepID=A0ABS1WL63_9FLAO|nr:hypothetical protein [Olleya sediminilitoris]MBL7559858.1 hypothetical protein [Olleya sediminilitoris]